MEKDLTRWVWQLFEDLCYQEEQWNECAVAGARKYMKSRKVLSFFFFETGFCYSLQAGVNSRSSCLSLPRSGFTGMYHHTSSGSSIFLMRKKLQYAYWYFKDPVEMENLLRQGKNFVAQYLWVRWERLIEICTNSASTIRRKVRVQSHRYRWVGE
jgi:hypothetical protein